MRSLTKALVAVGVAVLLALPAWADAQSLRKDRRDGWYQPPGTNFWMFPRPRRELRVGNVRIFPAQPRGYWPYGPPQGYSWPYGYPQGYAWPYGNSNFKRIRRGHRLR